MHAIIIITSWLVTCRCVFQIGRIAQDYSSVILMKFYRSVCCWQSPLVLRDIDAKLSESGLESCYFVPCDQQDSVNITQFVRIFCLLSADIFRSIINEYFSILFHRLLSWAIFCINHSKQVDDTCNLVLYSSPLRNVSSMLKNEEIRFCGFFISQFSRAV